MTKQPTKRQLQALEYVFFMHLTQQNAGHLMGISQQAVSKLLIRLGQDNKAVRGILHPKSTTPRKKISLDENRTYRKL